MKKLAPTAAILCLLTACSDDPSPKMQLFSATITASKQLSEVPSASAVELIGSRLWLITDDAPALFHLHLDGSGVETFPLAHLPTVSPRIPKPIKPDYEAAISAMIDGKQCIVAFGSGSLQPHRDSGIIVALQGSRRQQRFSLSALYDALRAAAAVPLAAFNIEGAALVGKQLLLLNRGGNQVFSLSWEAFLKHILEEGPLPSVVVTPLELPSFGQLKPMLSGACNLDDGRLLFSVSVEDTPDWISDGEVMGSGIGLLDVSKKDKVVLLALAPLQLPDGSIPKLKLEGLHAGADSNGVLQVVGVVDNDDGGSTLLQINLTGIPSLP